MKKNYLMAIAAFFSLGLNAQVLFSEDFSTATGTTPPAGWMNVDLEGNGYLWTFENEGMRDLDAPITDPAAIFDSDHFSESDSTEDAALESQAFDASVTGGFVLEFDHYFEQFLSDATYAVEVWDGTSWNNILTGTAGMSDPEHVSMDITVATGGSSTAKVRFHWTGSWDYYWIVDNVKVTRIPCAAPVDIFATNITAHTATLSWSVPGSQTNWNIEYGPEGFTPGTGTPVTASGTPTYAMSGLVSGIDYDVYIKADCGGGDLSASTSFNFSTLCETNVVSIYPWTENFDGIFIDEPELPCSWLEADVNNDGEIWYTTSFIANSAPNSLIVPYDQNMAMNDWAYTPGFAMASGMTYQLTFDYRVGGITFPENLTVFIGNSQAAASMTTELDDFPGITNVTYLTDTVNFTVPTTGTYYIGFHGHSDADQYYMSLDNLKVAQCPGCPLAIEENKELVGIELYPNPSKGLVHVTSPASNGTLNVSVVDFTGKEVLALPGTVQGSFDIDLSGFDNGVYFVKFLSGDTQSMQRIVVAK